MQEMYDFNYSGSGSTSWMNEKTVALRIDFQPGGRYTAIVTNTALAI
jgi:hypothetical protein